MRLGIKDSARNLSPKAIAKMAAWPIIAFAVSYAVSMYANLPRKLETSIFIAAVFLILGVKHTKREKKYKSEGESFFTKPWKS